MDWPRQVDPDLVAALESQQRQRRALLDSGAAHVGWKIGHGTRERIGGQVVIGYLTSATLHPSGSTLVEPMGGPIAEVEIAVVLGASIRPDDEDQAVRAAISGFRTALEVCDLARPPDDDAARIVADNVFHTGLALGAPGARPPVDRASLEVNGVCADSTAVETKGDLVGVLRWAARLLDAVDQRLSPGDVLITGGLLNVGIKAGDRVVARLDGLSEVSLELGATTS